MFEEGFGGLKRDEMLEEGFEGWKMDLEAGRGVGRLGEGLGGLKRAAVREEEVG